MALAAALAAAAAAGQLRLQPWVLGAYGLVCLLGAAVEAGAEPADAAAKSSRWLLSLALGIALATEATG